MEFLSKPQSHFIQLKICHRICNWNAFLCVYAEESNFDYISCLRNASKWIISFINENETIKIGGIFRTAVRVLRQINNRIRCCLLPDELICIAFSRVWMFNVAKQWEFRWSSTNDAITMFTYDKFIFTIFESNVKRFCPFSLIKYNLNNGNQSRFFVPLVH